jgi:hypothetical protein
VFVRSSLELTSMSQASRRKREERKNLQNGNGARTPPRNERISPREQMNKLLENISISDLLRGVFPPDSEQGPAQKQEHEQGQAGPEAAGPFEPGYGASRWNALRLGLRSKLLFPPSMQALIDLRYKHFSRQRGARSLLENWVCLEFARSTVKIDLAEELLLLNQERVLDRIETCWDADRSAAAEHKARGLEARPFDVARELERSKHGALLLISRWKSLGEAVATNLGLDEAQIQMCYDLLAIPKVLRNGSRQVPAANDAPALLAMVTREISRHEANLARELNARDESDRELARLWMTKEHDSITRGLRSDLNRAQRRKEWAEKVFERLRRGEDPAKIMDPDTKEPIKPDATVAPVPEPAAAESPPPAATPPPDPGPTSPEAPTESEQRPLPKGCTDIIDAEMLRMAEYTIDAEDRHSGTGPPPADEPGSPLA